MMIGFLLLWVGSLYIFLKPCHGVQGRGVFSCSPSPPAHSRCFNSRYLSLSEALLRLQSCLFISYLVSQTLNSPICVLYLHFATRSIMVIDAFQPIESRWISNAKIATGVLQSYGKFRFIKSEHKPDWLQLVLAVRGTCSTIPYFHARKEKKGNDNN